MIYLDPPFNSNTNYNILYASNGGADAQYRAFTDTWTWDEAAAERLESYKGAAGRPAHDAIVGLERILGPSGMLAYLTYMAERLEQMKRLLKPTGSIYLHCDPTASHCLKVVMDCVFGKANFRNEVVWHYPGREMHIRTKSNAKHDVLLFYSRSGASRVRMEAVALPYDRADRLKGLRRKVHRDAGGREWVWETRGQAKGQQPYRRFVDEIVAGGRALSDVWGDIQFLRGNHPERLGYPTQKPLALLERILSASSNEGDVVLDPFCGCGTTIEAAAKLRRRWAGIDISSFAIDLVREKRLRNPAIPTKGIPTDLASASKLAAEQPFNFESWAVPRLPGFAPNMRQVADGGIDGRATLANKPDDYDSRLALAQIKGGKFSLSTLRDFIHVTERDRAALGCYVTLDPIHTSAARMEVANAGKIRVEGYTYPRMQLWPISDYFDQRLPRLPTMNDPYSGKPMDQLTLL